MKYIPHWIVDALMSKKFKCHSCNTVFTSKNVTALGIRDSFSEQPTESFFIELICRGCNKNTFFEMREMNIVELSKEVISEINTDLNEVEEINMLPDDNDNENEKEFKNMIEKASDKEKDIDKEKAPKPAFKKLKNSKITLKDVRKVKSVLKPEDLKHESFLEMLGMTPERIMEYREKE